MYSSNLRRSIDAIVGQSLSGRDVMAKSVTRFYERYFIASAIIVG